MENGHNSFHAKYTKHSRTAYSFPGMIAAWPFCCIAPRLAAAIRQPSFPASPPASSSHCTLNGHFPTPTPSDFHFSGNVRTYYTAARRSHLGLRPLRLGQLAQRAHPALAADYNAFSIGTKWHKAVYRGYTDASFTQRSPQPAWEGIQGPTIHAEVGDLVEILFVNRLTTHYASMHSMGLSYTKHGEGAEPW